MVKMETLLRADLTILFHRLPLALLVRSTKYGLVMTTQGTSQAGSVMKYACVTRTLGKNWSSLSNGGCLVRKMILRFAESCLSIVVVILIFQVGNCVC